MNELAKQQAAQANVDVRFLRIPREVLDKRAVEQGDVRFFELAALDIGAKVSDRKVTVIINDFVIPADDVPTDVQKEIKRWSQWIDYWAIDWNNKNDTFHNEWQEYRTREKPKLVTEAFKTYKEHGEYPESLHELQVDWTQTDQGKPYMLQEFTYKVSVFILKFCINITFGKFL